MRALFLPLLVLAMQLAFGISPASAQMMRVRDVAYTDKAFLSSMIAHHQEALIMSEKALRDATDNRVKEFAQAVITDQKKEIVTMETLLKSIAGIEEKTSPAGRVDMSRHNGTKWQTAMRQNNSTAPDAAFVAGMLKHHKTALFMASNALVYSRNPEVLDLAKDIIVKQAEAMRAYKSWLAEKS